MSALEKARIFDPNSPADVFYVQFNPNTLEYSAGTSPRAQKGVVDQDGGGTRREPQAQQSPIAEERGASLSVRLFFHTYDSPSSFTDVRADIGPIRAFLPAPSGQGGASSPKMTFAWGTLTHTGTLESFHVSYQMFAHDGTPVQAEVSISIRGEDPDVTAESANRAAESESEGEDDSSLWDDISWLFQ